MTARLLGRFDDHSEEWYAARTGRLGGSEIAAVLGLSPWESKFSLWHRKAGNVRPVEDSAQLEWGRRIEPILRDKFKEAHGITRMTRGTYTHSARPWMLANPDGLWTDPDKGRSLVELKTAGPFADGWGEPGTDQVPIYYACQVRWYLGILGLARGHLAVLIGGSDYREYVVEQDADDWRLMVDAGQAFMDSLAAGTPPPIDEGSYATYAAQRQLHPEIDGSDIEVAAGVAADWLTAKAALERAKSTERMTNARLMAAMGTARNALALPPGGDTPCRVAYRTARGDGDPYLAADRKAFTLFTQPKETTAA